MQEFGRQSRIRRILDATSQLFNVIIFDGEANNSISGDAYRFKRERLRKFVDFLFSPWEKEHCRLAYEKDVYYACQLCKQYNKKGKKGTQ